MRNKDSTKRTQHKPAHPAHIQTVLMVFTLAAAALSLHIGIARQRLSA